MAGHRRGDRRQALEGWLRRNCGRQGSGPGGRLPQVCAENRDEIEALRVLYSKPYRAGLRFKDLKELAAALKLDTTEVRAAATALGGT